jgi:hypothetical protein
LLGPGDEAALEIHLARHWSTSTLMRANVRAGGLSDEGEYTQGTYVAMFDGATILGVAAHYRDGSLMLQAQRGLAQVVRGAVGESKAPVERIVGAWTQVNGAATALGADPKRPFTGKPETLATADLGKMIPENMPRQNCRTRTATEADLATLAPWRASYLIEREGRPLAPPDPDAVAAARAYLSQEIAVGNLFVAESTQGPPKVVAMASCEAWSQDAVQIGMQYTPGPWRDRAYTSVAVLGAAVHARNHGLKRAVLLSSKTDVKGQAATRTLGFVAVDEFGALYAPA